MFTSTINIPLNTPWETKLFELGGGGGEKMVPKEPPDKECDYIDPCELTCTATQSSFQSDNTLQTDLIGLCSQMQMQNAQQLRPGVTVQKNDYTKKYISELEERSRSVNENESGYESESVSESESNVSNLDRNTERSDLRISEIEKALHIVKESNFRKIEGQKVLIERQERADLHISEIEKGLHIANESIINLREELRISKLQSDDSKYTNVSKTFCKTEKESEHEYESESDDSEYTKVSKTFCKTEKESEVAKMDDSEYTNVSNTLCKTEKESELAKMDNSEYTKLSNTFCKTETESELAKMDNSEYTKNSKTFCKTEKESEYEYEAESEYESESELESESNLINKGRVDNEKLIMKNKVLEQKNQALEQELANKITECENTNSMLREYIETQNRKDCGISGDNAGGKDVGIQVCTLGIPEMSINTQDTVLRDKKGACPLAVPKSVDSTVRQINDIELKTALSILGPKFEYEPERPCTTKFLNFLHTLNDKIATVPMSGPTYNILVHSMLGAKASSRLGRLNLSTMPCKQFLDVCYTLLGQVQTQDRKRQDSLIPQGPDVLLWWMTVSNLGIDAGFGTQIIWDRFLEYVPKVDARFLLRELDNYRKETGSFPIDGKVFIIESLNDLLGKCRIMCEPKKAAAPKVHTVREGTVQQKKRENRSPQNRTQAQCTVGYAGPHQGSVQRDDRHPGPVCNSGQRGRSDSKGFKNRSTEKKSCRLCGNNSHWWKNCFIHPGQIPVFPPCSVCKNMYGRTLYHKKETCKDRQMMVETERHNQNHK